MISLEMPKDGEDYYVFWMDAAYGPWDKMLRSEGNAILFDSEGQLMDESPGIFHENNVTHDKISGDFQYHPFLNGMIPKPTAQYPFRTWFPVWDPYYPNDANRGYTCNLGLAIHRGSAYYFSGSDGPVSSSFIYHTVWYRNPNNHSQWTMYSITAAYRNPFFLPSIAKYTVTSRIVAMSFCEPRS